MRPSLFFLALTVPLASLAQKKLNFIKPFQFSIAPSISTNGLHSGGYSNYFSINVTSGYSAANYALEIAGISNLNENETRGLQFAGLVNVTGGNAFKGMQLKEADKKKREGFEANLSGAQFSGIANIVVNNVFGWQTSGGVNLAKGSLQGFQLAGISNTVYRYSFAVQLAGIYNVSVESMDGVQASTLFNVTQGGLYGAQVGMFNKAGFIEGINSYELNDPTAFQIGLVNLAGRMNGFQIGLVNIGRRMQGTQIGLINIFRNGKNAETRDGTPVGLINIGSSGHFAVFASDLFPINVEVGTGSIKNKRMTGDRMEKHIRNSLIYANYPAVVDSDKRWGLGYALRKYFFNRSLTPGMGRRYFYAFGIDMMHINHEEKKLTRELSLLMRPSISAGAKLHPRNRFCFFFASVSYNAYRSASEEFIDALISRENSSVQHWPGFSAGVMID